MDFHERAPRTNLVVSSEADASTGASSTIEPRPPADARVQPIRSNGPSRANLLAAGLSQNISCAMKLRWDLGDVEYLRAPEEVDAKLLRAAMQ